MLLGVLLASGCVDLSRPKPLHCLDTPNDPACVEPGGFVTVDGTIVFDTSEWTGIAVEIKP